MATLHVHLQEGFTGERVIVAVDDAVLLDARDVRTRMQIGYARLLEQEVAADEVMVHVTLPDRGIRRSAQVDPARTPWVGISAADDGALSITSSREAFGYV